MCPTLEKQDDKFVVRTLSPNDETLEATTESVREQLTLDSKHMLAAHTFAFAMLGYRGPTLKAEDFDIKIKPKDDVVHRTTRDGRVTISRSGPFTSFSI